MSGPDWLPPLVTFDGDWNSFDEYIERVYEVFRQDFVRRRPPPFEGVPVSPRRYPEHQGKHASFWHLVTEGKIEQCRYPVVERCERIGWPRALLEHAAELPTWRNKRRADERALVALPDFDYVLVLQERSPADAAGERHRFFLLLTAYPVSQAHRRAKLRKDWSRWHGGSKKG